MDNVDDIKQPLIKEENDPNPELKTTFILVPTLTYLIPLEPIVDIKKEPVDIEDYLQVNYIDTNAKSGSSVKSKDDVILPQQSKYIANYLQTNLFDTSIKIEDVQITPAPAFETIYLQEQRLEKPLFCRECRQEFKDFCTGCPMLLRILDRVVDVGTPRRARLTLPKQLLMFKSNEGVIAMRDIPAGVTFGPYEGLEISSIKRDVCAFKVTCGKLYCSKIVDSTNWMQFIDYRETFMASNLVIIQCDRYLYYRSCRLIKNGEELLVYFTKILEGVDYVPVAIEQLDYIFPCISCCMGFSTKDYLQSHWQLCPQPGITRKDLARMSNDSDLSSLQKYPFGVIPSKKVKVVRCKICNEEWYSKTYWQHYVEEHAADEKNDFAKRRKVKSTGQSDDLDRLANKKCSEDAGIVLAEPTITA